MRLRPFILCFNRTAISIQKIDSKSSKSHLKSLPRISPKSYRHRLYLKPFLIAIFNFSHKRPTFAFTSESGYTLGFRRRIAHKGLHGETGAFRTGPLSLPSERSTRFGNPAWPDVRTANFAAFWPWSGVFPKNTESLRNSDALMRVAVPRRRGPAGLRDLFRFCRNCGLYALFQILLSVFQTLQPVPFLCKLRLSSFLFGSEFNGFRSKQAGFFAIILENV